MYLLLLPRKLIIFLRTYNFKSASNKKAALKILLLENVLGAPNQKMLTLRVLQILAIPDAPSREPPTPTNFTSASLFLLVDENLRFTATTWDLIRYWDLVQFFLFNNLASVANFWYCNPLPVDIDTARSFAWQTMRSRRLFNCRRCH